MDKQLDKDLSSLNINNAKRADALAKTVSLFFKLWFVWAFVCLVGAIGLLVVAFHFLAKFW